MVFQRTNPNSSLPLKREEALKTHDRSSDPPRRLPQLLVIIREANADLGIQLEAATGGQHHDGGGTEGVLWRKKDAEVV